MGVGVSGTKQAAHLQHAVRYLQAADFIKELAKLGWSGDVVDLNIYWKDADVGAVAALSWTVRSASAFALQLALQEQRREPALPWQPVRVTSSSSRPRSSANCATCGKQS